MATELKRKYLEDHSLQLPPSKRGADQPPISTLPKDLLIYLFSFLDFFNDRKRLIRVCRRWKDAAYELPHWRAFCAHQASLAFFFPHLKLHQRKEEFEKASCSSLLIRGQRYYEHFKRVPILRFIQKGTLCLEDNPKRRELVEEKILCWINDPGRGELKWLDLKTAKMLHFPIQDYLSFVSKKEEKKLHALIQNRLASRVSCIDERYLIIQMSRSPSDKLFVLDRKDRKGISLLATGKATDGSEVELDYSDYTIWNGSLIFYRSIKENNHYYLFSFWRLNLENGKVSELTPLKSFFCKTPSCTILAEENFLALQELLGGTIIFDKDFTPSKIPYNLLDTLPDQVITYEKKKDQPFKIRQHVFNNGLMTEGPAMEQPMNWLPGNLFCYQYINERSKIFYPMILTQLGAANFGMIHLNAKRTIIYTNPELPPTFPRLQAIPGETLNPTPPCQYLGRSHIGRYTLVGDCFFYLVEEDKKISFFVSKVSDPESKYEIPFPISSQSLEKVTFFVCENALILQDDGVVSLYEFPEAPVNSG